MKSSFLPVLILVLLACGLGQAHPPEAINLSFDSLHVLTVDVVHPVKDLGGQHYVAKIVVELNGNHIITQDFRSQSSLQSQEVSYVVIDAKPGDKIAVTAECSVYGNLKETLTIP
jgi:hypothetical protein